MKIVRCVSKALVIIGALNWGLVGFFQMDLVAAVFGGSFTMGARVVYGVIGLAGLWALIHFCRCCGKGTCGKCGCSSSSCSCCTHNHNHKHQ